MCHAHKGMQLIKVTQPYSDKFKSTHIPHSIVLPIQQVGLTVTISLPEGYKGSMHGSLFPHHVFLVYSTLYCYTYSTDFMHSFV